MTLSPLFNKPADRLPNAGIFLSGSGSNAEKLLETLAALDKPVLNVSALITDAPETSRARELGRMFNIPVIEHDIKKFYLERGETRVSIATPKGQEIRELWTNGLREKLAPLKLDFGVFAGFVPLTNLTRELPCLNVHPGDLTYLKDGRRLLVGLHTIPVERAIAEGLDYMRSSVILVEPYSGGGDEMDSGHILGISPKVQIDLRGHDRDELVQCLEKRPAKRPKGGYCDDMEDVSTFNQNILKEGGDWVVLPHTVIAFAMGRYAADGKQLYFDGAPVVGAPEFP